MTYVPTVLTKAVGKNAQGQLAPNLPADVEKVQDLLRKALGPLAQPMLPGKLDDATRQCIVDFQQRWGGTADGVVDPNGQTLKRLVRLANPLVLKPIKLARVLTAVKDGKLVNDGGGYSIQVSTCDGGPLPPRGSGWVLYLAFINDTLTLDVTGRPLHDLMCLENLGELLSLFDRQHLWATTVQVWAQVRLRGQIITRSAPQFLTTPVQPHNGVLLPLDQDSNGPALTYQGDAAAKEFHGRMFAKVPGFDKYVFVYAGQFETQQAHRGFDCITYAGTACGASIFHMTEAADMASSLGATPVTCTLESSDAVTGKVSKRSVTLEKADPADVRAFFDGVESTGNYLMWSGGHVVVVSDGEVHEFKASDPSGYARNEVGHWLAPYKSTKLTVRRLPGKLPMSA
ncbi:MAG: peptidoglycan-binding protein [Burkholderiaceae bacterium]|nr:peptidoglycan-binding protein [Aquabacterium sp.]NUP85572.1 peptidoglycan-binding protein [Burkholderiaceae bacterium]